MFFYRISSRLLASRPFHLSPPLSLPSFPSYVKAPLFNLTSLILFFDIIVLAGETQPSEKRTATRRGISFFFVPASVSSPPPLPPHSASTDYQCLRNDFYFVHGTSIDLAKIASEIIEPTCRATTSRSDNENSSPPPSPPLVPWHDRRIIRTARNQLSPSLRFRLSRRKWIIAERYGRGNSYRGTFTRFRLNAIRKLNFEQLNCVPGIKFLSGVELVI